MDMEAESFAPRKPRKLYYATNSDPAEPFTTLGGPDPGRRGVSDGIVLLFSLLAFSQQSPAPIAFVRFGPPS